MFTLEASFAGAARGALAGKHFSQRDLMNVGKYVLRAFWEVKKLELNKNLLKELTEAANSRAKRSNDEDDDTGCDSSSEEAEPPTLNKKAIQEIEEAASPSPKKPSERIGSPVPGSSQRSSRKQR